MVGCNWRTETESGIALLLPLIDHRNSIISPCCSLIVPHTLSVVPRS